MTKRAGERQILEEVFPAEIAEIRRRRENADDDRALPQPSEALRPSAGHGLVGLAFSGGGIRSAAFSLGVLLVLGGIRSRARVLLLMAGTAGPLLILALCLLGCVYAITSPVNVDRWGLGEAVALLPASLAEISPREHREPIFRRDPVRSLSGARHPHRARRIG